MESREILLAKAEALEEQIAIVEKIDLPNAGFYGSGYSAGVKDLLGRLRDKAEDFRTQAAAMPERVEGEVTEAMIDAAYNARISGGSNAHWWFAPHDEPRALQNVRDVIKLMLAAALPIREGVESDKWPAAWKREGFNMAFTAAARALRFLADNERPIGGEQEYNSAHLMQISSELERSVRALVSKE